MCYTSKTCITFETTIKTHFFHVCHVHWYGKIICLTLLICSKKVYYIIILCQFDKKALKKKKVIQKKRSYINRWSYQIDQIEKKFLNKLLVGKYYKLYFGSNKSEQTTLKKNIVNFNKYLVEYCQLTIYLTRNVNLIKQSFFLLNKYLLTVNKCLVAVLN